jgi:hypothetical protein
MIEVIDTVSWEDLEQEFRQTTLLKQPEVQPYLEAEISLERLALDSMRPTTLYVVNKNIQVQTDLRADLQAQGYDSLALEGGLVLRDDSGEIFRLTPPIVESTEQDGDYLADGAHRSVVARAAGIGSIVCVKVANYDQNHPFYADTNDWDEIKRYDTAPTEPALKKLYRPDYSNLYRRYPNGGVPRG